MHYLLSLVDVHKEGKHSPSYTKHIVPQVADEAIFRLEKYYTINTKLILQHARVIL